jgi:hypothetical protein
MSTFQMEFHLPFFALRKARSPDNSPRVRGKGLRNSKDLLFLKEETTNSGEQENYRLYQAQISCVVHGFDEWQWVAYAFEDTQHEPSEHGDDNDDGDDLVDYATSSQGFKEDPIARGLNASLPIWRPRQYFLKALELRLTIVSREWHQLVYKLVADTSEYVSFLTHSF